MAKRWRRKAVISLALGTLLLLFVSLSAACAGADTVVVIYGSAAPTMDPQMHDGLTAASMLLNIYDTLLWRPSTDIAVLEPGLAVSWEAEDELTWVFHLREGVTFHNGYPFTAEDVKFTFDRVRDPALASAAAGYFQSIDRVEVVDPYTVKIITKKPDPLLLSRVASSIGAPIVSKQYVTEVGLEYFSTHPVGTGPYKFVSWVRDGDLILEANDAYWRGKPRIKTQIIRGIAENSTRVAALSNGEADIIVNLPVPQIAIVNASGVATAVSVPSIRQMFGAFDLREGRITSDVRVRKALNYAIDIEEVAATIMGGFANVGPIFLNPMIWGYDASVVGYPHDPVMADLLLQEAGWIDADGDGVREKDGQPLSITFDTWVGRFFMDREIVHAVAGQLEEIGVSVTVIENETALMTDKLLGGQWGELGLGGIGNQFQDADASFNLVFHSCPTYPNCRSVSVYNNPAMDRLIEEAGSTVDPAARLAIYSELQRFVRDQALGLFLFEEVAVFGVSDRLDWTPRGDQMIWLFDASIK